MVKLETKKVSIANAKQKKLWCRCVSIMQCEFAYRNHAVVLGSMWIMASTCGIHCVAFTKLCVIDFWIHFHKFRFFYFLRKTLLLHSTGQDKRIRSRLNLFKCVAGIPEHASDPGLNTPRPLYHSKSPKSFCVLLFKCNYFLPTSC